jgi:hypothetical protein
VAYRPWWGEAPERPKQVRGGPDFPVRGVLLGLVVAEPVPLVCDAEEMQFPVGVDGVYAARFGAEGQMVPIG